jgi:nucleoid-associated protein YgaU
MAQAAAAAMALEAVRNEQAEAERRAAEKAREQERAAEEARKKAEAEAAEQAAEARRRADAEARRRAEEQERSRAEAEAREKAAQEARLREEEERRRCEEEQLRREKERNAAVERLAQEQERLAEAARREDQERRAAAERLSTERAQPSAVPAKGGRKHAIAVAVLVVAAVTAMVLMLPKSAAPPVKRSEPVAEPAKKESQAPSKEPEAPLVLNVPTSMPRPETVVYVVVKGDTLWGISTRFTGDPFNYPRVAKDNSIATPDLIFPGQKIRLVQER